MVQDLLTFLRPMSPNRRKDNMPLARHDSVVSNPSIHAITQPLPIRRSDSASPSRSLQGSSSQTQAVPKASSPKFCGIPLSPPKRRYLKAPSLMSLESRPYTPTPVPDPFKRPRPIRARSCQRPTMSSETLTLSTSVSPATGCNLPSTEECEDKQHDNLVRDYKQEDEEGEEMKEVVRTRDSEVLHIAQIRTSAASRQPGHWLKISPALLTARERASFDLLRKEQQGPILSSQVLAIRQDPGHRPMQLQHRPKKDEYWDVDPFDDTVYVVQWVPDDTTTSDTLPQQGKRNSRPWSMYSKSDRPQSSLSYQSLVASSPRAIRVNEISTIRLVM